MSRPANREGGTTGYKTGNLRYRLDAQIPFNFSADFPASTGVKRARLILKGLSSLLNVQIHVGLRDNEGNRNIDYPALPGTVQVTPFALVKGGQYLYGKPLGLVPETIPHQFLLGGPQRQGGAGPLSVGGDFGATGGDGAEIEILIDADQYGGVLFEGALYVFVMADYNGNWWDVETIQTLFGQLNISQADAVRIQTSAG